MSQKKKGFYLDDDDPETSMYFNNGQTQSNMFQRDAVGVYNTSASPSQSFTPTSNMIYPQQSMNSRGYNGNSVPTMTGIGYQRSTPTSMLQPQSPNRSNPMSNMAMRSFPMSHQMHPNILPSQPQSIQKRLANNTNYSGFGQPQAFSFPQQPASQSRSSGINATSSSDLQQQSSSQVGIDLSAAEFPSLTNRSIPTQPNLVPNIRNYVGMVGGNSKNMDSGGEFSMVQEDFPALPGSIPSSNGQEQLKQPSVTSVPSESSKDSLSRSEPKTMKGVQTLPDGTITNIPAGMLTDQFGMIGLLTFIRAAETDANLVALAPGVDLTTLGLNLNSVENLYSTFQSPWADGPCRPQDIDYHVPAEYLTNAYIREKLSDIKFNKFGDDLLFYLFYCNPGDGLQMAASIELYTRNWRYHKEEQVWLIPAAGSDKEQMKSSTHTSGHYYIFDPLSWRKVVKELHNLEYSKLEEKKLPNPNQQQQQAPATHSLPPNH